MKIHTLVILSMALITALACAGSPPPSSPAVIAPAAPAAPIAAPAPPAAAPAPVAPTPAPPAPAAPKTPAPPSIGGTCDWETMLPIAKNGAGGKVPAHTKASHRRCLGDWATVVLTARGLDSRTPNLVESTMVILWKEDGAWKAFFALPEGSNLQAFCEMHESYLTPIECAALLNIE